MTRARTLADMISDGVIGTTELADDAITPVKLDETGNYTIAQLDVNGTVTSDGLTVAGIATVQDSDVRIDLTAAPSASGEVIGDLYFRSENSYGGRQDAGLIRSISASNWGVSREAAMEFHTTYNSTMNKRMRINNNGDIVFYNADGSTTSFLYDADVGTFFNYAGQNRDFRISSDNQTNLFAIDGESDKIGLGRFPLSGGSGNAANEGAIQIADGLGTVPLFINGGADYAGMKLKRDGTNNAGGTDGWNWTIRPSYASGVASGGDISYLKINSVYDAGQGGQLQHEVVFNEDQYNLDFRVESDNNANMFFVDASQNRVLIGDTNIFGDTAFQIYQNSGSTSNVRGMTIRNASPTVSSQAGMLFVNYDNIGAKIHSRRTGSTEGDLRIQINTGGSTTETSLQDAIRVLGSNGSSQAANIFNEGGADMDFRVESDGNANAFFVDAQYSRIGINNGSPSWPFDAVGNTAGQIATFYDTGTNGGSMYNGAAVLSVSRRSNGSTSLNGELFRVGRDNSDSASYNVSESIFTVRSDSVVVNESSSSNIDFRVESNTNDNMLFVDASLNSVVVGGNAYTDCDLVVLNANQGARGNLRVGYNRQRAFTVSLHGSETRWFKLIGYTGGSMWNGRCLITINRNGGYNQSGAYREYKAAIGGFSNSIYGPLNQTGDTGEGGSASLMIGTDEALYLQCNSNIYGGTVHVYLEGDFGNWQFDGTYVTTSP